MWGSIILFAVAAAVYLRLLAVVVIILTRPNPQPLLWACYLASLAVSVGGGVVIFAVFRSRETIAGTSSHRLGPAVYLTAGLIAILVATLISTRSGRALVERSWPRSRRPRARPRTGSAAVTRTRARAEQSLSDGSIVVACLVGAVLAVPGPFDLLAIGRLARSGYGVFAAATVVFGFALIKFALIEVPIVGYVVDPDGTAAWVGRFSGWMKANKVFGVAAIVGLFGVILIGRGISGLA